MIWRRASLPAGVYAHIKIETQDARAPAVAANPPSAKSSAVKYLRLRISVCAPTRRVHFPRIAACDPTRWRGRRLSGMSTPRVFKRNPGRKAAVGDATRMEFAHAAGRIKSVTGFRKEGNSPVRERLPATQASRALNLAGRSRRPRRMGGEVRGTWFGFHVMLLLRHRFRV